MECNVWLQRATTVLTVYHSADQRLEPLSQDAQTSVPPEAGEHPSDYHPGRIFTITKHNMSEKGVIQDTLKKNDLCFKMQMIIELSRGLHIVSYCLVNILQIVSALTCCRINIKYHYIYI